MKLFNYRKKNDNLKNKDGKRKGELPIILTVSSHPVEGATGRNKEK